MTPFDRLIARFRRPVETLPVASPMEDQAVSEFVSHLRNNAVIRNPYKPGLMPGLPMAPGRPTVPVGQVKTGQGPQLSVGGDVPPGSLHLPIAKVIERWRR